jgi:hypothetical protein
VKQPDIATPERPVTEEASPPPTREAEGQRRRDEVLRRTGRPWHPVYNWDPNISADGMPCADDR